jgi:Zn-dependent protease
VFDAAPTPFDLNFRLLGFPVRVSPWFWGVMAMLGWPLYLAYGGPALLIWVATVFASILLHELGHAVLFRLYGAWTTQIVLHGFGGYARPDREPASRWKQIAIAAGGPGAQFLLLGVLVLSHRQSGWAETNEWALLAYEFLWFINLFWALFNLLPVWPLDGGRIARQLAFLARVPQAEVKTLALSTLTAGGLAAVAAADQLNALPPQVAEWLPFRPSWFGVLFLGLMAYQSYELMGAARRAHAWDDRPVGGGW